MPNIILRPTFNKDLDGLRLSSRKHYQRASEILLELQRDQEPSAPRRPESRIPNCVKFELPDGYRLVMQRTETEKALLALVVGTHDHVESFLDGHKAMFSILPLAVYVNCVLRPRAKHRSPLRLLRTLSPGGIVVRLSR